jgi:hypothetical protein
METKSMAYREIGPVLLQVHPAHPPTDEEWDAFLRSARRVTFQGCRKVLVVTAGWGPDVKQRAMAGKIVEGIPMLSAVVSDAPLVRGIVTALSWFNKGIRSFPFNGGAGILEALKYLDVESSWTDRILREVRAMQREVGAA